MVTRVNGGIFNNQALTGSLCHYRILGANFSGAISDGNYVVVNGAGPNIDLTLGLGEPVPNSAAEIIMGIVTRLATVVITNPTSGGLYFATENNDSGWLDVSDLQQEIVSLGDNVGVDGLDLTGVTVEKVDYILSESGGDVVNGLKATVINGQTMVTLTDTSRGGKELSVAEQDITFSANRVGHLGWLSVGNATHADAAYILDYDGTVVAASGLCVETSGNIKVIRVNLNGVEHTLGVLGPAVNSAFSTTILDVDFNQGDSMKVRAYNGSGEIIRDVIVKITVKWRGV